MPLVNQLIQEGTDSKLSNLVTEIVMSRQFRYRRESEERTAPANQTRVQPALKTTEKEGGL
jgi:hypothetical protein